MRRLKASRILAVRGAETQPSTEVLGIPVDYIAFAELNAAWAAADKDEAKAVAERWAKSAALVEGVSREELVNSAAMYLGQKAVLKAHGATGITVNCLGGFYGGHIHAYPCLGFHELLNEGLVGGCECDVPSSAALTAVSVMTQGRPGYISDPVMDTSTRTIIYAHCVASNKPFGPKGAANPYQILTHSEDRQGASVRSVLPAGWMTTTIDVSQDRKEIILHRAKAVGNDPDDRACRTKLVAKPVGDFEKLFSMWDKWGWHRVTVYGDIAESGQGPGRDDRLDRRRGSLTNEVRRHEREAPVVRLSARSSPLSSLAAASPLAAVIKLPSVIGDHMVVQRDKPVAVWGWAAPAESIVVRMGSAEATVKAGPDGLFAATLPALKAGGPLRADRARRQEPGCDRSRHPGRRGLGLLRAIQHGMAVVLGRHTDPRSFAGRSSPPAALPRPQADLGRPARRHRYDVDALHSPRRPGRSRPWDTISGSSCCKTLDVPIGLIESAWGGTDIEPWTPPAGFDAVPSVKPYLASAKRRLEEYRLGLAQSLPAWQAWIAETRKALAAGSPVPTKPAFPVDPFDSPQTPTGLYNAMIHALVRYPVRGAIWYQGENNRNDTLAYEKKMEALILGWRSVWKTPDLHFFYVQLAPYYYAYNRDYAGGDIPDFLRLPLIWEAQSNILRMPYTGMAVITDITDLMDIHPRNKRDVGHRLSLWARAKVYGESSLVPSGPLYRSMTVEGGKARIVFDHVGGGLMANDGQPLKWFEIAGEDRIFYRAEAKIEGDTVVVSNPRVAAPKAVRFGWHQMAVPNLANQQGLPASPFRTDRW